MAIANGWNSAKLEALAKTATGGTPARSKRAYFAGTIPWVKSGELDDNFIYDTEEHLSPDALRDSSAKLFPKGTVLVALYGATVGKTAILETEAATNQAVCAIFVDHRLVDYQYLRYFIMYVRPDLLGQRYGGAQPNISQTIIRNTLVHYPGIREQQQIAAVLSAVQRAVERQERLIALTAELKKALMHKLFTEGTRGEPLKQTEIGPVPESWPLGHLREFLAIKHGYAFDGAYFRPDGERILMTPGHIAEQGGFRDQGKRTKYYIGEVPPGYALAPDDLLVVMTEQKAGLLGSAALVPATGTYLHNQRLGLVTLLNEAKLTKHFLYFFFNRPEVKSQVALTAIGSKVRHTSPGKLLDLIIALPTVSKQRQITDALQRVDTKQNLNIAIRNALTDLFHTLLHQLMTARIRVHDLDLAALGVDGEEAARVA
jgi:type I restriction enzyme S subunit